ncbi:hypothetical protein JDM601_1564 [Mycolicibacter sinensis]|uniref:Uncharacterized protein n=3 Tax=Mycobacteriaceae TaxID=1762 RepID=F5YZ72_MYCSD|nr:hypothetical protein JDM601_1564 [Mycolicibacter sinensis]BBX11244.1 hypothetical protein MNVM_03250 [Mycobacterium novum]GFG84518.1 hypothetical protein MALGJ_11940 [Mycolicibacter algericus]
MTAARAVPAGTAVPGAPVVRPARAASLVRAVPGVPAERPGRVERLVSQVNPDSPDAPAD